MTTLPQSIWPLAGWPRASAVARQRVGRWRDERWLKLPVLWSRGATQLEETTLATAGTLGKTSAGAGFACQMSALSPPPDPAPADHHEALNALRPNLEAYCRRRLGRVANQADVDECVSETLRRALEGHAKLRSAADLSRWAFGIARYVTIDRRRGSARELLVPGADDDAADDCSPETDLITARRKQALLLAMETLPEHERRAIIYFHVESKSYREIGELLGVPLGTVCTWIARARKRLELQLSGIDT